MSRAFRLPLAVLAACSLGFAAYVVRSVPQMPARMATHFDINGIPNGWMTRDAHAWGMIGFGIGVPAFIVVMFSLVRLSGGAFCNLPNRDYWLAPERCRQTLDFLLIRAIWLACLMVIFAAVMHAMILTANAHVPVRLPLAASRWAAGSILGGVLIWVAALLAHFLRRPYESKA